MNSISTSPQPKPVQDYWQQLDKQAGINARCKNPNYLRMQSNIDYKTMSFNDIADVQTRLLDACLDNKGIQDEVKINLGFGRWYFTTSTAKLWLAIDFKLPYYFVQKVVL